jgi:succinate dehydrogenase cytochrome b subunit
VPIIAVIDTNVWVSAFINPNGYPAQHGRFGVIMSRPLEDELRQVILRPRILKVRNLSPDLAERFAWNIIGLAARVEITGNLHLCRDSGDDMVLETAFNGQATHIVSRDGDIVRSLDLMQQLKVHNICAITVSRFLREIETVRPSHSRNQGGEPMSNNLGLTLEQSIKYQGRFGQWAWIFHRVSGLGVLLFLTIHIVDTSFVYFAPPLYEEALKLYKSVPFGIGEIFLMAAVLYHAANGIRVALVDFFPQLTNKQREMWMVVWALFLVTFIPSAYIMGRGILHSLGINI